MISAIVLASVDALQESMALLSPVMSCAGVYDRDDHSTRRDHSRRGIEAFEHGSGIARFPKFSGGGSTEAHRFTAITDWNDPISDLEQLRERISLNTSLLTTLHRVSGHSQTPHMSLHACAPLFSSGHILLAMRGRVHSAHACSCGGLCGIECGSFQTSLR
jgi:hypothetical protein